jgi:hypothetical protein
MPGYFRVLSPLHSCHGAPTSFRNNSAQPTGALLATTCLTSYLRMYVSGNPKDVLGMRISSHKKQRSFMDIVHNIEKELPW